MRCRVIISLTLISLGGLGLPSAAQAQDPQNWKRLESMPSEQRHALAQSLNDFDLLPPEDQTRVRELDAELAKLDPATQARYLAVMKRYHVWVQTLSEPQKAELDKAGSFDAKLTLVEKWKKAERHASPHGTTNLVLGVYPGDLGVIGPFELANPIKVWLHLDEKERARIEAITPVRTQIVELMRVGRQMGLAGLRRFPLSEEEKYRDRFETMEQAKSVFPGLAKRVDPKAEVKKVDTKAEAKKGQFAVLQDRVHHVAESLYFMDHPPAPVTREHLAAFEAELPPWFRASIDPLSAEDARRRLTIIYRQIYEPPNEFKPTEKKSSVPAKAQEKPKVVPPKSSGTSVPL